MTRKITLITLVNFLFCFGIFSNSSNNNRIKATTIIKIITNCSIFQPPAIFNILMLFSLFIKTPSFLSLFLEYHIIHAYFLKLLSKSKVFISPYFYELFLDVNILCVHINSFLHANNNAYIILY